MLPIIHHDAYVARDVPATHRFPMGKFRAVAERCVALGLVKDFESFHRPVPAPESWLQLAHSPAYVSQVLTQTVPAPLERVIGFKMTAPVAMRSRCAVAGTALAARLALEHGAACNTAGGSHHAAYDGGAGFCVFNDVAVAARLMQAEGLARRILVIDLDVHQGDGTARIFENDASVFTLSVHCEQNWPRRKAVSDMDVGVERGTGDDDYLRVARSAVIDALEASRPDLVFFNAGVDPHREDRLGLLDLTDEGLKKREAMVFDEVLRRGVPVVGVLGGGYSRDIDALARRHAFLHEAAAEAMRVRA
ncbi:MAG: histone deacetylase family protein [Oceanicaulis sp.]